MLQIRNLYKAIDGTPILKGIKMNVKKGSIYGLIGPNGAGKTTLIRHITGVYKADEGKIFIDGSDLSVKEEVKALMAYVPDEVFYFNDSTILSMVDYYKGIYESFDEDFYFQMVREFSNLNQRQKMRKLSKGMGKQVALLLALAVRPKLLILDEPMDGLDPIVRKKIRQRIMTLVSEEEMTVIISSHNLRELEDICDAVGMIKDGELVTEQSLVDLEASMVKFVVAFKGDVSFTDFDIVSHESNGRMHTLILRGEQENLRERLEKLEPVFIEQMALSLEEIFIYELGGKENAFKEILNQ